ncbi:MAG: DUF960 family protein [Bacillota bacterium]
MTRGIANEIPVEVQAFMWNIITEQVAACGGVDYLQVFTFSRNDNQLIVHYKQEIPEVSRRFAIEYRDEFYKFLQETIFVIDEINHSTMLFAHEY